MKLQNRFSGWLTGHTCFHATHFFSHTPKVHCFAPFRSVSDHHLYTYELSLCACTYSRTRTRNWQWLAKNCFDSRSQSSSLWWWPTVDSNPFVIISPPPSYRPLFDWSRPWGEEIFCCLFRVFFLRLLFISLPTFRMFSSCFFCELLFCFFLSTHVFICRFLACL